MGGTAAPVTAKQNQNKEQVERKNQALVQLRRLLVQGNRKVEALAAVIQHLFSEVPGFISLQNSSSENRPEKKFWAENGRKSCQSPKKSTESLRNC